MNIRKYCSLLIVFVFLTCVGVQHGISQKSVDEPGGGGTDTLKTTLVTVGPGDELYSWWGHSAIVIEDNSDDTRILYDYGQFSFEEEDFLKNFVFGRLWFSVGRMSAKYALQYWDSQNRYIGIQELNLSPAKERELQEILEHDWLPENRVYLYDHYYDNCATRERDILNHIVDGQLRSRYNRLSDYTLRDLTRRYTYYHPLGQFVLMIAQGRTIDRPITLYDEMFLPRKIEEYISTFHYRDEQGRTVPLVRDTSLYSEAPHRADVIDDPPGPLVYMVALGVGMAVAAMCLMRFSLRWYGVYTTFFSFIFGILGSIMFFMSFFTNHTVTYANENLLFINPLVLAAVPFAIGVWRRKKRALVILALLYSLLAGSIVVSIILKSVGVLYQDNVEFLLFFLPIHLVLGPISFLRYRRSGGNTSEFLRQQENVE
jgi:hypothetical protein